MNASTNVEQSRSSSESIGARYNLDADQEKAVLGAVLLDPRNWRFVATLSQDDFTHDSDKRIFQALGAVMASGKPLDELTVREELIRLSATPYADVARLANLTTGVVPVASRVAYNVAKVRERAGLRHIAVEAEQIATLAAYGFSGVISEVHERLVNLTAFAREIGSAASAWRTSGK